MVNEIIKEYKKKMIVEVEKICRVHTLGNSKVIVLPLEIQKEVLPGKYYLFDIILKNPVEEIRDDRQDKASESSDEEVTG